MHTKFLKYWDLAEDLAVRYAGSAILAIIVLIVGWWLIKRFSVFFTKWMVRREVDVSLRPFLKSIIVFSLRVLLIISVAGMVGIKTTSFIAVLGAAGLAIGLALQGSLSNFAGGVIILLLKPFKVGEYITASGMSGTVTEIHVFYTYITSDQNQDLIIPNGQLANTAVTNFSRHDSRRMDMTFSLSYDTNIETAKKIMNEIISEESALLKVPPHNIYVQELANNAIKISIQAWLKSTQYLDVVCSFPEKVKKRFDEAGISAPQPSLDVRLANSNNK